MANTAREIPFIAHMVIIDEPEFEVTKKRIDDSYYNYDLDSDSPYCQNTTSWD